MFVLYTATCSGTKAVSVSVVWCLVMMQATHMLAGNRCILIGGWGVGEGEGIGQGSAVKQSDSIPQVAR
jgi:hypothetical protein